MKKKLLYFGIILLGIVIIFAFYSRSIDSANVRNGVEPKFTIKIISKNGNKVIHLGLGYKVVRYVSVSPSEPYKNNRGVKYGSWFMKYVLTDDLKIEGIYDISDGVCDSALEEFYQDDEYIYYFECIKSEKVLVKYTDGSYIRVSKALKDGNITINDLDTYKIKYIKSIKK